MKIVHRMGAILIACCLSTGAWAGEARSPDFGAGVILGEPTGFTGKLWQRADRAVDGGLAFSFDHFVFLYSDYLFHFKPYKGVIPYVGIGGGLLIYGSGGSTGKVVKSGESGVGLGLRIPVGAEWFIPKSPLGLFLELVPGMSIIPSTTGWFQGGIGIRYYFER